MNTDFRILSENTFNLKADKLHLMLLRENGNFGIEVVDHEKSFGRVFARDRTQADLLFELLEKRLDKSRYTLQAEIFLRTLFSLGSIDKMLFLLAVDGARISEAAIGRLVRKFKLSVRSRKDFIAGKKKRGAITIWVCFESRGKMFGRFSGTRLGKDFLFELL